jgi:hypothetical protein
MARNESCWLTFLGLLHELETHGYSGPIPHQGIGRVHLY